MFQLNGTEFLRPFEYFTQNAAGDIGSFSWTVQTNKDLSVSNMFYLCLFVEGESASAANSHYFNITGTAASAIVQLTSTTQSTSSTETTSSTHTTSSTIADTPTPTSAAESTSTSSTDVVSPPPAGMSVGVKAGIGIGIAAAITSGIIAGWFIFGRRKRKNVELQKNMAMQPGYYQQEKFQGQMPYQWGNESTVVPEMFGQEQRHQLSDESTIAPRMYEQAQRRDQFSGGGTVMPHIYQEGQRNHHIYELPDYRAQ
ncbi:hypothetical protein VE00_01073 [Pseudogymnoascus sp. WSF 3629]|nr:hypothetical protein VE00_01073 [Pseudogymnoascus sp. WSF 3629]